MEINVIEGRRVSITSLYPDKDPIYLRAGVYEDVSGRNEWTGESLMGEIPYQALLEWGIKEGFLKFNAEERRRRS